MSNSEPIEAAPKAQMSPAVHQVEEWANSKDGSLRGTAMANILVALAIQQPEGQLELLPHELEAAHGVGAFLVRGSADGQVLIVKAEKLSAAAVAEIQERQKSAAAVAGVMKQVEAPEPPPVPELAQRAKDVLAYITNTPTLLSLLYDIELMPEQHAIGSTPWAMAMTIADAWMADHASEAPTCETDAITPPTFSCDGCQQPSCDGCANGITGPTGPSCDDCSGCDAQTEPQ